MKGFPGIKNVNPLIAEWLILLTCFGYPLHVAVILMLRTPTAPVNMAIRAVYLAAGVYLIGRALFFADRKFLRIFYVFLLFWIMYLCRLVYDIEYKGLTYGSRFYVYSYAVGVCFIPAAAVLMNRDLVRKERIGNNLYRVLLAANLIIIAGMLFLTPYRASDLFRQRLCLMVKIHNDYMNILNEITLSAFGSALFLFSLCRLLFKKNNPRSHLFLYSVTAILGLVNLFAGASRGPFLAMILISFFLLFYKVWDMTVNAAAVTGKSKGRESAEFRNLFVSGKFRSIVFPAMIIIILGLLVFLLSDHFHLAALKRFQEMTLNHNNPHAELRILIWKEAWLQFIHHPIFGDSYLTPITNTYSHNLFLDSLMSTGIAGSLLFFYFSYFPFQLFFRKSFAEQRSHLELFIIYLSVFLISCFSGGLFVADSYWIFSSALILILSGNYSGMKKTDQTLP